jgi:hypothetical protein
MPGVGDILETHLAKERGCASVYVLLLLLCLSAQGTNVMLQWLQQADQRTSQLPSAPVSLSVSNSHKDNDEQL